MRSRPIRAGFVVTFAVAALGCKEENTMTHNPPQPTETVTNPPGPTPTATASARPGPTDAPMNPPAPDVNNDKPLPPPDRR